MELQPTETQVMMRESLRDLLEREVSFDRLRELERSASSDHPLWALLHRQGWLRLPFSAESDGDGGSLVDVAIVVDELSRRATLTPYVETVAAARSVASSVLAKLVIADGASAAVALFGRDDLAGGNSASWKDGRLEGRKWNVDYARDCTHHVVAASDASGEVGLFLIDRSAAGIAFEAVQNVGHIPRANVSYTGVPAVKVGARLEFERLLDIGTLLSAVQCLSSAEKAFEMTLSYTMNRVQFGRPIASFQAVQHECADMATLLEMTRFLVYEAVWRFDGPGATAREIARAKWWAARTAVDVTIMAHQLHGGMGVTEEYDLNFFSRRAKDRALAWMSQTEAMSVIAESVQDAEAWV